MSNNIPLFNLKEQYQSLREEINREVIATLDSGCWILGERTKSFEQEFAKSINAKYAIGCSSGASAIQIALVACGVGKGDEVITSPLTFVATTTSITLTGADFKFADIDPNTYCICPKSIEKQINSKTKAILPVHLYGYPSNMKEIMDIAKKYNLIVVEDCAQSHLSKFEGQTTGGIGDAGAFSFYPSKTLGACGDAGAITTNNKEIMEKCMSIRHSGRSGDKAYEYNNYGSTLRMDEIQATILSIKLKHLAKWTEDRNKVAAIYAEHLKDIDEVRLPPSSKGTTTQSFYVYTIGAEKRDELSQYLSKHNIGNGVYYPIPLYSQPIYNDMGFKMEDYPNTEREVRRVLSLPMFPELTEEQVKLIAGTIKDFYTKK